MSCAGGVTGAATTPHWLPPIPSSPYLQLQPGGGLCAHAIGTGASQALSAEGPVADWSLTNEVQQRHAVSLSCVLKEVSKPCSLDLLLHAISANNNNLKSTLHFLC